MAIVPKPTLYPFWTDGSSPKVVQPPAAKLAAGWSPGEPPLSQHMNWLFWDIGQWVAFLDQQGNTTAMSAAMDASVRLAGGGVWSYSLATNTLSWSLPFYLLIPGISDTTNSCPAGSIVIPSGSVAYVTANIPYTTQGDISSGSATVLNLAYQTGIKQGMAVTGGGIPSGTTVSSVGSGSLTLSQSATSTASQQTLTFASSGALTMASAAEATLQLNPNTVIIARSLVSSVILGVNSGQTLLRDAEQKALLGHGYLSTIQPTAGQALTAGQPVYMSLGSADNARTPGAVYPIDCSVLNGAMRTQLLGIVYSGGAAGSIVGVATDGVVNAYTGLVPGVTYYADPTTPGGITAAKPTVTNQYAVPLGTALSTTSLHLNPAQAATVQLVQSLNPWPNYAASTEAQLAQGLASAANGAGGVIVLTAAFSLSQIYTVPGGCIIQGRKGNSLLTLNGTAGFLFSGDGAELRDVSMVANAAGPAVNVSGNYNILRGCNISLPSTLAAVGIQAGGHANRFYNTVLSGVTATNGLAVGINYTGIDNSDDSTVVLS